MTNKMVVVTSATGRQGGATAHALLADGFRVRAFVRDAGTTAARRLSRAGAELAVGDMDDRESLETAMRGAYGVFSLQPSLIPPHFAERELERGLNVADAAHAANVHHIVYVSVGGADRNTGIPHWEIKWRIEEHIRRRALPFTMLRPTMFMENYADSAYGVTSDHSVLRTIPPDTIVQHIAIDDIGAFAALAFAKPAFFIGKALELAGDELTRDEVIATISRNVRRRIPGLELPNHPVADRGVRHPGGLGRFGGWHADIPALRSIYPKLLTFEAWLTHGGAAAIERLFH